MAYVAARGGENAIQQAERLFQNELGVIDAAKVRQVRETLPYLIDRVMGEASLYAPDLAALALAQSGGDLSEALLLLRSYRTTQPRIGIAEVASQNDGITHRRISASFKNVPGGQILGPTLDYSHRLLKVDVLAGEDFTPEPVESAETGTPPTLPSLADWQRLNGLVAQPEQTGTPAADEIPDLTREVLLLPASRALRLQSLARADTGGTMALGYATMRGYGPVHPTVNELRLLEIDVRARHPAGFVFLAGRVRVSQAEVVSGGDKASGDALELGFSATFGWNEIKAISAATLDLTMSQPDPPPAANEEFVLYHTEAIEASGFCLHFKLPHYVTFQSSLDALRKVRAGRAEHQGPSQHEAGMAEMEFPQ